MTGPGQRVEQLVSSADRYDSFVSVLVMVWWALGRHESRSRSDVVRTLLGSSSMIAPSHNEHP